jgi:hypothetical protein
MNDGDSEQDDLYLQYRDAQDVNELIRTARSVMAEASLIPAQLTALDKEAAEDAALDLALGMLSNWILLCGQLPVDTKEGFTQNVESLIEALRRVQEIFTDDQVNLKERCFIR